MPRSEGTPVPRPRGTLEDSLRPGHTWAKDRSARIHRRPPGIGADRAAYPVPRWVRSVAVRSLGSPPGNPSQSSVGFHRSAWIDVREPRESTQVAIGSVRRGIGAPWLSGDEPPRSCPACHRVRSAVARGGDRRRRLPGKSTRPAIGSVPSRSGAGASAGPVRTGDRPGCHRVRSVAECVGGARGMDPVEVGRGAWLGSRVEPRVAGSARNAIRWGWVPRCEYSPQTPGRPSRADHFPRAVAAPASGAPHPGPIPGGEGGNSGPSRPG